MRYIKYIILILSFSAIPLIAGEKAKKDWSDLYEEEKTYYGSEKFEKYPVDLFFMEREKWENHSSFMFFWFFKTKDYPKFKRSYFLPFFYKLESKIDNRKMTWALFGIWYDKVDGPEELRSIAPFYYSNIKRNGTDRSLFYLYWWGNKKRKNEGYSSQYRYLIPFFFNKNGPEGYTHILPPIFMTGRNTHGEFYAHMLPLMASWRSIERKFDLNDNREITSYNSSTLSLFYSRFTKKRGEKKWDEEPYSYTSWIGPLLPLSYYHRDRKGSHTNLLWLADWSRDSRGSLNRFWMMPFFFHKKGPGGYTHILPPIFMTSRNTSGEFTALMLPLMASWRRRESLKEYTSSTLSPLYSQFTRHRGEKKWDEKPYSITWWIGPIFPLSYYHRDRKGSHTNLLWLADWSRDSRGSLNRFWMMPFFFHKKGPGGYTHILPPLVMTGRNANGEFYAHMLPLMASWRRMEYTFDLKDNKKITRYTSSTITPIYSKFTQHRGEKKWDERPYSLTRWIGPLIPLSYTHTDNKGTHRNIFWLIDWYRNSKGQRERLWIMPFFFNKKGEEGYTHILPPLFMTQRNTGDEFYAHMFPLMASWRRIERTFDLNADKEITSYDSSTISPFYFRFTKQRGEKKWDEKPCSYTSWVGPVIPLFYKHSDETGTHRNLFWIIDWKENRTGSAERFWLFPLALHEWEEGGYRYYFPFYHRPSGWSREEGKSFGILHYHRWSKTENSIWIWPYYSRYNLKEKIYFSLFLPLGASWRSEKSSGDIFLPVLFNYRSKRRSYHVNILGLSRTAALGPASPDLSLDVGKYKGNCHLDTDISWLYDLFSISSRITLKNPFKKEENITPDKLADNRKLTEKLQIGETEKGKTGIVKKKTVNRESSEYFWGLNLLYGLAAFERADSRRHFRLLPLSWITWDKESDDKLYVVPLPLPVIRYKSIDEDSEYTVVFPFYGNQREGKSYSRGYLLNLFWDQYDDEKKLKEKTFLWPIINRYSSPVKSGWRVFPFIWRKKSREKGILASRFISPLYYSHYRRDEKTDETLYKFVINPLSFSRKIIENESISERTLFPLIPFCYHSMKSYRVNEEEAPLSSSTLARRYRVKERLEKRSFLFPFYFSTGEKETSQAGTTREKIKVFAPLFLTYYESSIHAALENRVSGEEGDKVLKPARDYNLFMFGYSSYNNSFANRNSFLSGLLWKYRREHESGDSRLQVLYGLYRSENSGETRINSLFPIWDYSDSPIRSEFNILYGLWGKESNSREDSSSFKFLYGWVSYNRTGAATKLRVLPFFSTCSSPDRDEFSFLLGLYNNYSNRREESFGSNLFWGLVHQGSFTGREFSPLVGSRAMKTRKKTSWFFPLVYHSESSWEGGYKNKVNLSLFQYRKTETYTTETERKKRETVVTPLLLYSRTSEYNTPHDYESSWNFMGFVSGKESYDYSRFFIFPFLYRSNRNGERHTNILGLIDFRKDRKGHFHKAWVLPLWISYTGRKSFWTVPPLLTGSLTGPHGYSRLVLGTYWHISKEYERENIFSLWDHRRYNDTDDRRERDIYSVLFSAVKYDVTPEINRFKLLWGALLSKKTYASTESYEVSALFNLFNREANETYSYSHFFPLWYYKNYNDPDRGYSFLSPIILSCFSKDRNGDLDLGLLGLVYFRKNNIPAQKERRMVLLGTLYNEVRRPEKGLHSEGSFWGALWEKETESKTGYRKFAILKEVYKKVTYKGKTRHKILGIMVKTSDAVDI